MNTLKTMADACLAKDNAICLIKRKALLKDMANACLAKDEVMNHLKQLFNANSSVDTEPEEEDDGTENSCDCDICKNYLTFEYNDVNTADFDLLNYSHYNNSYNIYYNEFCDFIL